MSPRFVARVAAYITLRRRLGNRLCSQERLLLSFGQFLDRLRHRGPVTIELALRWARSPRSTDPGNDARRLATIRGFLRHHAALDPKSEVPPPWLLGSRIRRKPPHVYTAAECDALLHATKRLYPLRGLRPKTYATLFALLLATGLRISEALALEVRDVDLDEGVLTVRNGKLGKSRLLPLHASAIEPLRRYRRRRDALVPRAASPFFFCTQRAPRITYVAARMTFGFLRRKLGWTSEGRARRPRIHDLRHTFAVRCLVRWNAEGTDVDRRIAHLATYLGHVEATDTYWYLSAVPELTSLVAARFERYARRTGEAAT